MATEEIVLSLVNEYRSEMGRIGCRKLQHLINDRLPSEMRIGRNALYALLENSYNRERDNEDMIKSLTQ